MLPHILSSAASCPSGGSRPLHPLPLGPQGLGLGSLHLLPRLEGFLASLLGHGFTTRSLSVGVPCSPRTSDCLAASAGTAGSRKARELLTAIRTRVRSCPPSPHPGSRPWAAGLYQTESSAPNMWGLKTGCSFGRVSVLSSHCINMEIQKNPAGKWESPALSPHPIPNSWHDP